MEEALHVHHEIRKPQVFIMFVPDYNVYRHLIGDYIRGKPGLQAMISSGGNLMTKVEKYLCKKPVYNAHAQYVIFDTMLNIHNKHRATEKLGVIRECMAYGTPIDMIYIPVRDENDPNKYAQSVDTIEDMLKKCNIEYDLTVIQML